MDKPLPDSAMLEIKKLQGTWRQIHCEADGVVNPPDECGSEPLTIFSDQTFIVMRADGVVVIKGTLSVDPSQEPKAIDYTDTFGPDAGKTFPAIYSIDGDVLTFCAADADMDRPIKFETGVGETLRIHRRVF